MQNLKQQNQLLKQYVKTLQQQNDSKNRERNTLIQQLDRMSLQLDQMRSIKPVQQIIQKMQGVPIQQFTRLQSQLKALLRQRDMMIQDFQKDMYMKQMESQGYQQQVKKLSQQISILKKSQMAKKPSYSSMYAKVDDGSYQKIEQLSKQKANLEQKLIQKDKQNNILRNDIQKKRAQLNQMFISQQNFNTNNKINETKIQKMKQQFFKVESNYQKQIKQLQMTLSQNAQQLQNSKQALSALIAKPISSGQHIDFQKMTSQLAQLQNSVLQLQNRNNKLQRDKINLQNRIVELESQSLQKSSTILILQKNQSIGQAYQNNLKVKQKQIKAIETINQNLRHQIDQLNLTLQQKDLHVKQLEHIRNVFEGQLSEKDGQLQKLSIQLQKLLKMVQNKNQQYETMAQNYNDKVAELTTLVENYEKQNQNNKNQDQSPSNQVYFQQMNHYLDDLNQQNTDLKQKLAQFQQVNKQLMFRLTNKINQNCQQDLSQQQFLNKKDIQDLRKQNQDLKKLTIKSKTQNKNNQEDQLYISQIQHKTQDLQKYKIQLQAKVTTLQQRLKKYQQNKSINNYVTIKDDVSNSNTQKDQQYFQQLNNYLKDLQKNKIQMQQKIKILQQDLSNQNNNQKSNSQKEQYIQKMNHFIDNLKRQNQELKIQISKSNLNPNNQQDQQYNAQLNAYIQNLQKHKQVLQAKIKNIQENLRKSQDQNILLKKNLELNIKKLYQNQSKIYNLSQENSQLKNGAINQNKQLNNNYDIIGQLRELIKELRIQLKESKQANLQRISERSANRRVQSPVSRSRKVYSNYHWIGDSQTGQIKSQLEGNFSNDPFQTFPEPNLKNQRYNNGHTPYARSQIPLSPNRNYPFNLTDQLAERGIFVGNNSKYDDQIREKQIQDPYDIANLTRNAQLQIKNREVESQMIAHNDNKPNLNKQKWQNLQRKINSLRQQNEQLKKSISLNDYQWKK